MSELSLVMVITGSMVALAAFWVWTLAQPPTQRWVPIAIVASGVVFVLVVLWAGSAYESSQRQECRDRGGSLYLPDDDVCLRGDEEVPLP